MKKEKMKKFHLFQEVTKTKETVASVFEKRRPLDAKKDVRKKLI